MAAPFLRVGRLSEQRLRLESSFGILRGTPSLMDFSTRTGNPKKPVRYTSIKGPRIVHGASHRNLKRLILKVTESGKNRAEKEKPKTIIDIGKLILQRANDSKSIKQSVIADVALKAATRTAKHPALKQSAVPSDSAATTVSTPKAAAAASSSEPAANPHCDYLENGAPTVSDTKKTLATSSSTADDLCVTTSSGEQGNVSVNGGQEKVSAPVATKNSAPVASSSSGFSVFSTSLEGRTTDPKRAPDEMTSSPKAPPETDSGAVPVPIDVTYSEEVPSVDDAPIEPSVEVLSATGMVTTEMVISQSVSAVDIPVTAEVFIPTISPAGHSFAKPSQVPECAEILCAVEGSISVSSPTFEVTPSGVEVSQTQVQDGGALQTSESLAELTYATSSSKTFVEEGLVAFESPPEVKVASDFVLEPAHDKAVVEETASENMSASDDALEKAVIFDLSSGFIPVDWANQPTTTEIPEDSTSQAEDKVALAVSMDIDPDLTNQELAEEKLEGAGAVRESEAQLDPIKRLFLDKIREYSTKSKAYDGPVDAGPEYEKAFSEELAKLQRLYGNGDLTAFPEFQFPEPMLDEINPK